MNKTYTQAEEDRARTLFKVINILSMRLGDGSDDPQLHIATKEIMGIIDQLIATTRRDTVEEIRKIFIDKNNEIVGDNQFMESKYSFSQIMNTLDQLPDKQEA